MIFSRILKFFIFLFLLSSLVPVYFQLIVPTLQRPNGISLVINCIFYLWSFFYYLIGKFPFVSECLQGIFHVCVIKSNGPMDCTYPCSPCCIFFSGSQDFFSLIALSLSSSSLSSLNFRVVMRFSFASNFSLCHSLSYSPVLILESYFLMDHECRR